jgi:hypothetical protein
MPKKTNATVLFAALVLVFVLAGSALAAKPNSSIALVLVGSSGTAAATAVGPSYGDQITFNVSTTVTDHPSVNVRCYQDATWVYDGWQSFWPGYAPAPVFTLTSLYWTSGAADCTARLVYFDRQGRERLLASTAFSVTG